MEQNTTLQLKRMYQILEILSKAKQLVNFTDFETKKIKIIGYAIENHLSLNCLLCNEGT